MFECPKCKKQFSEDIQFCSSCNSRILPIHVPEAFQEDLSDLGRLAGKQPDRVDPYVDSEEAIRLREMLKQSPPLPPQKHPMSAGGVPKRHRWWKEIFRFRRRSHKPAYIVARDIILWILAVILGFILLTIVGKMGPPPRMR
jgi:hypothetical protein